MAVSIVSQPTTPNVAGTKLLFEVTSSNINYPQYNYILDIYQSGSSNRISRMLQVPNRQGAAVFDPSSIIEGQLYTENIINIISPVTASEQFKTFDFKFGEAYGTSTSSSLSYYADQSSGSVGVFNGTVNPNQGYNFPSQSYMPEVFPFTEQAIRDAILTDAPYIFTETTLDNFLPIGVDDRHTYSILKQSGYTFRPIGIQINAWRAEDIFNGTIAFVALLNLNNVPNPDQGIVHIPAGPQNLLSSSFSYISSPPFTQGLTVDQYFNSYDWYLYTVNVIYGIGSISSTMTQGYKNENLVNYYNIIKSPSGVTTDTVYIPVGQDKLRFAFANRYGALDYFNCYAPLRRGTSISKNIVSLPKVNYSDSISTYSYETGGDYIYQREYQDQYVITTPLLNQETANWIEQLLESPEAYIVQGQNLVPIVITNSRYTSNTDENRQKVFTYDIEFKPANGRLIEPTTFNSIPAPNTPRPGQCDLDIIISNKYTNCG